MSRHKRRADERSKRGSRGLAADPDRRADVMQTAPVFHWTVSLTALAMYVVGPTPPIRI
jgi:hypothetical protein